MHGIGHSQIGQTLAVAGWPLLEVNFEYLTTLFETVYSKHEDSEENETWLLLSDEASDDVGGGVSVDLDVIIMLHIGGIGLTWTFGTCKIGKLVLIGGKSNGILLILGEEETQLWFRFLLGINCGPD